jgi:hypothetical protein
MIVKHSETENGDIVRNQIEWPKVSFKKDATDGRTFALYINITLKRSYVSVTP